MMIRVLLLLLLTFTALARQKAQGYCEQGNHTVSMHGYTSTTKVQRSFPSCTVTVYLAGTPTLADIYSDDAGTPKPSQFTASATGYWFFYADDGRYDLRFSGGGIATPFTIGDFALGVVLQTYAYAQIGAIANGRIFWCSDCNPGTTPCTSGGTGALASKNGGASTCYSGAAGAGGFNTNDEFFTSTEGQTIFTPAVAPNGNCWVFLNGVKQRRGASYDYEISGVDIVFTWELPAGETVEIVQ